MGANDPRGRAILDSRGMVHRIYVKLPNMEALTLEVSEKTFCKSFQL